MKLSVVDEFHCYEIKEEKELNVIITILAFLLMLNVIVIIHEAGHFFAARSFGVHCHEFSIGMGPAIYQKQGKNTLFSIRALPIGGYVMMAGEEDGSQSEDSEDDWLAKVPESERLNFKPKWQQVIIMAAGVFMNFVLAFLIFIGLMAARGYVVEPAIPVIDSLTEGYPAKEAGLMPGDQIVKIVAEDGTVCIPETTDELSEFLAFNPGESTFTIERDGENFDVKMTPHKDDETQMVLLGFTSTSPVRQISFLEAIPEGIKYGLDAGGMVFRTFGQLFQGKGFESLSGPVGIYKMTDTVVSQGLLPYISLFAILSLNIGIFNLLPIPALDGGRILIIALESIFRRKIPTKIVEGVIIASFVLIFGLMIFSSYNDIVRLFF